MTDGQPQRAWFSDSTSSESFSGADSALFDDAAPAFGRRPTEFERLWLGFMTARLTLGLMLLVLQSTLWALGLAPSIGLIFVCGSYFALTLAIRLFLQPLRLRHNFNIRWALTIGVDVVAFATLQFFQGGAINYAPLLALPVLLASILGSLSLAMGTAAGVTLLLLAHSTWLWLYATVEPTAQFAQSALTGAGCFVIAFLSSQLSARLAVEEQRSRRSRMAVRLQQQVNELVIDSLSDGILVVDAQGQVRAANPAARRMMGESRTRRDAAFNLALETAWGALADMARQSFKGQGTEASDVVLNFTGQGLRRLHVRTRLTPANLEGEGNLCVMFLQDQREMQARMRTEKLASMGRMSAAVAHEIRNPLAAIAQANALLDEEIIDTRHKRLTQMVAQNANRLGKIVDEVLNVSRVQTRDNTASAQYVLLNESVQRIHRDWQQQQANQAQVGLFLAASELRVAFETEHLRRVLINLLDNALRFISGKPKSIQIFTDVLPSGQSLLGVWSDGQSLEQSVERHLFEPFFSSDNQSTGLGLYICRALCEGHGASIGYQRAQRNVESTLAEGNEFLITFRLGQIESASNRLQPQAF